MARTTLDCKKFLVDFFTRNPQIMNALFSDDPFPIDPAIHSIVINVKNWKRIWKINAAGNGNDYFAPDLKNGYLCYIDGQPVNRYAEGQVYIPAKNFIIARGFDCDPGEGQIAYIVLEDASGNLTLGNYIGD